MVQVGRGGVHFILNTARLDARGCRPAAHTGATQAPHTRHTCITQAPHRDHTRATQPPQRRHARALRDVSCRLGKATSLSPRTSDRPGQRPGVGELGGRHTRGSDTVQYTTLHTLHYTALHCNTIQTIHRLSASRAISISLLLRITNINERITHAPAAPPTCVGEASAEEAHEGLRISAIQTGTSAVSTRQRNGGKATGRMRPPRLLPVWARCQPRR